MLMSIQYVGSHRLRRGLLDPEDDGTATLWNINNCCLYQSSGHNLQQLRCEKPQIFHSTYYKWIEWNKCTGVSVSFCLFSDDNTSLGHVAHSLKSVSTFVHTCHCMLQVVKWNHMQKDVVLQRLLQQKNLCTSVKINLVSNCWSVGSSVVRRV